MWYIQLHKFSVKQTFRHARKRLAWSVQPGEYFCTMVWAHSSSQMGCGHGSLGTALRDGIWSPHTRRGTLKSDPLRMDKKNTSSNFGEKLYISL